MEIATSVLSVTDQLGQTMKRLNMSSTDYLHLDVMDGKFVSNHTVFQMDEAVTFNQKPLDIHLMVEDVLPFIQKYQSLQPAFITFHVECGKDISSLLSMIKAQGIKAGLALNPSTKLDQVMPYLKDIDLILVMSVPAGYGGQRFDPKTTNRITTLRNLRSEHGYHYQIEVDGGINRETVSMVQQADIIVSGTYIVNGNIEERIEGLRQGAKA